MLKSCSYCGKIHQSNIECPQKPKKMKAVTEVDRFRWTKIWQRKRDEIRERDKNLCQVCLRNLYDTDLIYNYYNLSVHHAIPVASAYEKRLDNDNLITLCDRHHEMAESGAIPYEVIKKIIEEQEQNNEGIL